MDDPLTQAQQSSLALEAHPLLSSPQQSTSHAVPVDTTPAAAATSTSFSSDPQQALLPSTAQPIIVDTEIVPSGPRPSGFASAQSLAALAPSPEPYTEPPPYVPPPPNRDIPSPTGVVRDGRYQIIEDGAKSTTGWKGERGEEREITLLDESEVRKFTVGELKKRGLGRVPTGYCYSSRMTLHQPLQAVQEKNDDPHPEQPARIIGVFRKLEDAGLTNRMERIAVREAVKDEILLVHSLGHWERIRGTSYQTIPYLLSCADYFERLSIYVNPESAICARLSCGGVIEMCRAVAEGTIRNGFAIVRPPGHHAEPDDAMGFCFFNNAAIAAKWLRTVYDGSTGGTGNGAGLDGNGKAIKKVLILDWDVHHGNGTQKAFWDDPNVLYISLHRHDGVFYPGGNDGSMEMVGEGAGKGFSVNIPFPNKGMGDADYIYAFQQVVMPIAYEFAPDFVIVSAGYDAAEGDTLGQMKVSPAGFAHMTHLLSVLANGKLVLALEGGYNVESIAKSALACVEVLVGDEPRHLALEAASASATNVIHEVKMVQSHHWKCMGEAVEGLDQMKEAGKVVPIAEILKAHRTYDLYHAYRLFNIEFADSDLEASYHDQLLCSENVYECETLVIFMHDLGSIKASFTAASRNLITEKTFLIETSSQVLDWAMKDNNFGLVDINFLAHISANKGQPADPARDKAMEDKLALYIWDNIVTISIAKNVILFGSGCGCSALMAIVQNRPAIKERVKACISVLGLENPPELDASSGNRVWYKENSLVLLPSTHVLHEDSRKAGKHQKKFGNILRASPEDEGRPIHLLKASLPKIKQFIAERLPAAPAPIAPVVLIAPVVPIAPVPIAAIMEEVAAAADTDVDMANP